MFITTVTFFVFDIVKFLCSDSCGEVSNVAHVSLLPLAALYNQTLEKKRFECHFNECLHFKFTFEKIGSNLKYHRDMNLVGHSIKLCEARRASQEI